MFLQLLDLMHTLHTRAASIFSSWAEEEVKEGHPTTIDAGASALWLKCWCPLLQGMHCGRNDDVSHNFVVESGCFVFGCYMNL